MLNTANQATLRALLAHGADLMVVIDPEGRRTFVAPSVESVTGRTAQQLVGEDVFSYIHPEDAARARALLQEHRGRGGSVIPPVQLRYQHAAGHWIWLEVVARNLMDHPAVGGILIHGREITAHKEAQQQLELERRRYRALVESSTDLIATLDPRFRFTYVSSSAEVQLGSAPTTLLDQPLLALVHPGQQDEVQEALLELGAGTGATLALTVRMRHANGTWRTHALQIRDLRRDPAVGALVLSARDLTDQVEAEQARRITAERYRALAEHSADIIRVLDAQGVQRFVSPSVEPVLGSRPDQVVGTAFAALVHPDDRDLVVEQIGAVLDSARPRPPVTLEYRVRHASGAWHSMEATLSDLRDNAAVNGLVLASRDITRRKLAEDKIVKIEGELQNTMMTDPTTGIANRRAFLSFGDHHIRIARRLRNPTGLIQVRIGNLAEINQSQGLEAGDRTLRGLAEILRKTFRDTDVIARIGGATFAVLAMVRTPHDLSVACDRLMQRVVLWNAEHPSLEIRVALGGAATSHQPKRTLSELMDEATQRMGPSDDPFQR